MTSEERILDEMAEALSTGALRVEADDEAANRLLMRHFPFAGPTRIDWTRTLNHHHDRLPSSATCHDDFAAFFDAHLGTREDEKMLWANTGARLVLSGSVAAFRQNLEPFVDMFWENYFFAANGRWCLYLGHDGDVDYGESTVS